MRWFFPAALGFFLTLALAMLLLLLVPGLWPLRSTEPTGQDLALLTERHREADLRRDLALLEERYLAQLLECRTLAQAEEEPEVAPETPVEEPVAEPVEEPVQEPPSDDLVIPEEAEQTGDMEFLMGCWLSETGLVNMDTGQPVTVKYCFNADGQGTREIDDERGFCSGPASASMGPDGALRVEAQAAPCDFGAVSYIPSVVSCRGDEDRRAVCHGEEGGVTWDANFQRIR